MNEHSESQLLLILDDNETFTQSLAAALERENRTIITCNDLESAELVVETLTPSHIVSDVRLTGAFGFEGLQFIEHARQHSPESRIILMTGDAPEALQMEAAERGAVAFLRKPFEIQELDAILDMLSCSELSEEAYGQALIQMPLLDSVLSNNELRPLFQPIVALDSRHRVIGYEALARYRGNVLWRNPELLFEYAQRKRRVADLELSCITEALRSAARLPSDAMLFMNVHPAVLNEARRLQQVLLDDSERFGISPDRIVLEITEQGSIADQPSVFQSIEEIRRTGIRFAFDDIGIAYSHLPYIDRVKPAWLKISQHFGTGFEADPTKMKIVSNLLSLARSFGCDLVLEGIEADETARAARAIGIKYGQGFLFGHPAEPERWAA